MNVTFELSQFYQKLRKNSESIFFFFDWTELIPQIQIKIEKRVLTLEKQYFI